MYAGKTFEDFSGCPSDPSLADYPNIYAYHIKTKDLEQVDGEDVECASSNDCAFQYNRDYTPTLVDIIPSNVYFN